MTHFLVTVPPHGSLIANENGEIHPTVQSFFDDLVQKLNDNVLGGILSLESYTVTTLPNIPDDPALIFVSDESGGAVPAFSDGANWRRVTDRAIVT